MEKIDEIMSMMEGYFPSDPVIDRWIHFHSSRFGVVL